MTPPGMVGIVSSDQTRWAAFSQSLLALQPALPPGSTMEWVQGYWISVAINMLIRRMPPQAEWLCLLADDHTFQPAMLWQLLAHDVAIVAPLCCLRRPPFAPSLYHQDGPDYRGYTWEELRGKSGLLAVDAMGGPGVIIRRHVLETLPDPWFENHPLQREAPCEDLYFFSKAQQAGFQPYCDLDTPIGHIVPSVVTPKRQVDGSWYPRYGCEEMR